MTSYIVLLHAATFIIPTQPIGVVLTPRRSAVFIVPATSDNLVPGQILNTHDSFHYIRIIVSQSSHKDSLLHRFLCLTVGNWTKNPWKYPVMMLQPRENSVFRSVFNIADVRLPFWNSLIFGLVSVRDFSLCYFPYRRCYFHVCFIRRTAGILVCCWSSILCSHR